MSSDKYKNIADKCMTNAVIMIGGSAFIAFIIGVTVVYFVNANIGV